MTKLGKVQTINMETGAVTSERENAMMLLPPAADAMAHCTVETRAMWRRELVTLMRREGMAIPADLVEEGSAGR